jgi:hypothetical protein
MEASGYASAMSDFYNESVYLISLHSNEKNDHIKVEDGYLNIFDEKWIPLRGVFRYVTQKPWNRIPISTKTAIYNPIIACLAGGRNKMMAAKAYEFYNAELEDYGLHINTPETIREVNKEEIPFWVKKMGGYAVIKVPYSNAGQGVFTIVNEKELDEFMKLEFEYKKFIIQSLIGNYNWSSHSKDGKFYHVGTIPNLKMETYVVDVRMMVISTENGIKPVSVYSRRAEKPLSNNLSEGTDSWAMLGTNLSVKLEGNKWESETNRLMLMDRKDFNKLGISIDSLIEAYIQTVLSTIAIDKMSKDLVTKKGSLKKSLFKSLNNDATLIKEILDF